MALTPIRILYVLDVFHGPERGGTERQFFSLLEGLDRSRIEPHVALFRHSAWTATHRLPAEAVIVLGIDRVACRAAVMKLLRLSRYIRRGGIQLAHVLLNDASIAAPAFCRVAGARVVGSRRDMGFWYTTRVLASLRTSNLFVSRIVANSEAVRDSVRRREHFPASRIDVIYNGHDPSRFDGDAHPTFRASLGLAADDPVVGMVAHFHRWKRHEDVVRAFAIARRRCPAARLVLVGSGATEPAIRRLVASMGLESHVHFVGSCADPLPIVRHFSIGVLCSDSEGSSNAVIEYMASAKPTICTTTGGNGELIADGETGFLVPPGDVDALANRLSRLLGDRALRERMGSSARAQAVTRWTANAMVQQHMRLYEALVCRTNGRVEAASVCESQ